MEFGDVQSFGLIKQGNVKHFEQVFKAWYAPLCNYALKFLKDHNVAEEVVQDVFYLLWKNRQSLTIDTSLKAYLYKAVQNKSLHYLNHLKVVEKSKEYVEQLQTNPPSPLEAMQSGEFYQVYLKTLEALPQNCRDIFNLSREQGLKYNEIAERLQISVKTVEANVTKALKAFKQNFATYSQQ